MTGQADRPLAPALLIIAGVGLTACTPASAPGSPPGPLLSTPVVSSTAEAGAAPEAGDMLAAPPGDLLGLDEATLRHWFGPPSFVRHDYPAEVWQYRAKACVLELYLYPADDHMAVSHAEATSGGAQSVAEANLGPCLSALAEAKRKAAPS
jgi:hypothetical protein